LRVVAYWPALHTALIYVLQRKGMKGDGQVKSVNPHEIEGLLAVRDVHERPVRFPPPAPVFGADINCSAGASHLD